MWTLAVQEQQKRINQKELHPSGAAVIKYRRKNSGRQSFPMAGQAQSAAVLYAGRRAAERSALFRRPEALNHGMIHKLK